MNTDDGRGQIITFYSYKGGTGRSMALANIACILAEQQISAGGKGVLMIDWDLEAPGLHRYFGGRLTTTRLGIEGLDRKEAHNASPGLIDLFYELDKQVSLTPTDSSVTNEQAAREAIDRIKLSDFILSTTIPGLSLLKAGRFASPDPNEYSERVNKFNWESLFKKSPHLMRVFAETLAKQYAYVLIDSRTGITDISGITTMLLPEKLVVVFTPNLQSLKGGLELVRKATEYRKESVDLRPLTVFPLVSRVETNEPELRFDWRFGNMETDGFQREFERILSDVYGEKITLNKYFEELQIQHIPKYAYGEQIAVLTEKTSDRFSLRRSYQTFAMKLVKPQAPWDGEIDEPAEAEQTALAMRRLVEWFNKAVIPAGSMMLPPLFVAVTIGLLVMFYSRSQQARQLEQSQLQLQQARDENADLNRRLADVQRSEQILKESRDRIDVLMKEVQDARDALDAANQEVQRQGQAASQNKQQADRAVQAQKRAETTLQTVQADRDESQRAYQDTLTKYVASQREVRNLQAKLATCRP